MTDIIAIFSTITLGDLIPLVVLNYAVSIMAFFVSFKFFNVKFSWGKLLFFAFFYAFCMLFIRKVFAFYKIPLGTHTLYMILVKAVIFYLFFKMSVFESFTGSVATSALILAATPVAYKIVGIMQIDFKKLAETPLLFSMVGHVESIYLILATIVLAVTNFHVYKILDRR